MKKSKLTDTQMISVLREVESGMKVEEVCRKRGIRSATDDKWKSKFGGMDASELKRIRALEEENTKLKRMYADVRLENRAMKDGFSKKGW
jgi:putative transposase